MKQVLSIQSWIFKDFDGLNESDTDTKAKKVTHSF